MLAAVAALVFKGAFDVAVENVADPRIEQPLDAVIRITTANIRTTSLRSSPRTVGLDAGDIMLMYTDGLIERRGEDLAEGIARLAGHLQAWRPGMPLGRLCDQLISSLAVEPQQDDMCVLAISRQSPSDAGTTAQRLPGLRADSEAGPLPIRPPWPAC